MDDLYYRAAGPVIEQFHYDNSFVRGIRGPVGSSKTVSCCFEIFNKACTQVAYRNKRYSRWALIRNTYSELRDTTLKTWNDWFDSHSKIKETAPMRGKFQWQNPNDGTFIDLELWFIALDKPKDVSKMKSLELTGAFLNEAVEMGKSALDKATERVRRYPGRRKGGITWSGVILDTNSCDDDHWWYTLFEENLPEGYAVFNQPAALLRFPDSEALRTYFKENPKYPWKKKHTQDHKKRYYIVNHECENVENQPFKEDYWLDLVHGKDSRYIEVFLMNQFGTITDARPVYPEYIDDWHCAKKELKPVENIGVTLGFDFGNCYSDDTEVLTKDGWKYFKNVDENRDLVATKNPETKQLEYTPINFKVAKHYRGKMIEYSGKSANFCVTPEHQTPFTHRDTPQKINFALAEWLYKKSTGHHYLDLCSRWKGKKPSSSIVDMTPESFCRFMGLYLSEGSFSATYNRIAIAQKQGVRYYKYFQKILDSTGLGWMRSGNEQAWRVSNGRLRDYLSQFGRSYDKYVPQEIKDMPPRFIRLFLYTYTFGDGHIRVRNGSVEHTIFTVSRRMADDFQELAQKLGWSSSLRKVKPQDSVIIEDGKSRTIKGSGGFCVTFKKKSFRTELFEKNFKYVKYSGMIYCLNVPYHTLYVRRNGKPHWNGNTPACSFSQTMPTGQKWWIDELYVKDHAGMGIRQFSRHVLVPHLLDNYLPWLQKKLINAFGDPAGKTPVQTDSKTCFMILRECLLTMSPEGIVDYKANAEKLKDPEWVEFLRYKAIEGEVSLGDLGVETRPARTNDLIPRIDSVQKLLIGKIDGKPMLQICPIKVKLGRKGFRGKYCYMRIQVGGEARYHDVPKKNIFSHLQDGFQADCLESEYFAHSVSDEEAKRQAKAQREEIGEAAVAIWDEVAEIKKQLEEDYQDMVDSYWDGDDY